MAMKLGDRTGEIPAKIWSADEETYQKLEPGRVISLTNVAPKIYKDQIQLDWEAKNKELYQLVPEEEVDYSRFLPHAPGNLEAHWQLIQDIIATLKNSFLQDMLRVFFDDPRFTAEFLRVPAALKRHHAYVGGLLEHTAGVTSICRAAAEYYPYVHKDLLLAGAILHDIGKVRSYKLERGIDGTDEGKLIGHLVLGMEMVQRAADRVIGAVLDPGVQVLKNQLLHLLVSHHGIMEWGSPVEPLTLEATILHHADNMDAQITKFLTIIRAERPGAAWSAYDPGLGRSIYLAGVAYPEENAIEEEK